MIEPEGCVWRHSWPQADKKRQFRGEWTTWNGARQRCHNPDSPAFPSYGGRGIIMCPEWFVSFDAFIDYIGPKPSPEHSLDRIDNNRGYEPGNVRWATWAEQSANRRRAAQVASGMTPGQIRLSKANEIRRRISEEKQANRLRERGWRCVPPDVPFAPDVAETSAVRLRDAGWVVLSPKQVATLPPSVLARLSKTTTADKESPK